MLPKKVKARVLLQVKLITILCFAFISCVENNSSTQESVLNDSTRDASLGHYLSLLPGGISLEDISSGRLYSYGDLPPKLKDVSDRKKTTKKSLASNDTSFFHKCAYCMQKRLKRARLRTRRVYSFKARNHITNNKYLSNRMFSWPIRSSSFWISCYFGRRARGRLHKGLDLAAVAGTPVTTSAAGIVDLAVNAGTFGNMVLIRHRGRLKTRYAHLQSIVVKQGQFIPKGKLIGYVGNTGRVTGKTGHHLHFEVLINNIAVNPMRFLA